MLCSHESSAVLCEVEDYLAMTFYPEIVKEVKQIIEKIFMALYHMVHAIS